MLKLTQASKGPDSDRCHSPGWDHRRGEGGSTAAGTWPRSALMPDPAVLHHSPWPSFLLSGLDTARSPVGWWKAARWFDSFRLLAGSPEPFALPGTRCTTMGHKQQPAMGHCVSERAEEQGEMENEDRQLYEEPEEQLWGKGYGINRSWSLKKDKEQKRLWKSKPAAEDQAVTMGEKTARLLLMDESSTSLLDLPS